MTKMNALKTFLLVSASTVVLSGCGELGEMKGIKSDLVSEVKTEVPVDYVVYPDDRPSIPDGAATFDKMNCASCHGAKGVGGSARALADKSWMQDEKPVELYKFLAFGKPGVSHERYLNKLANREVWNLVAYTRSLACPPLSQDEIAKLTPVFGANCAVCHGTKGDGDGPLARNLEPWPANFQTFKRFYDRTDKVLIDHIANGIKWEGMPNFLGKEDTRNNFRFDHQNIERLVAYVRNFHISNDPTLTVAGGTPPGVAKELSSDPAAGSDRAPDNSGSSERGATGVKQE